jgi:hypothetical protein
MTIESGSSSWLRICIIGFVIFLLPIRVRVGVGVGFRVRVR